LEQDERRYNHDFEAVLERLVVIDVDHPDEQLVRA
jgi:hypothetical protein